MNKIIKENISLRKIDSVRKRYIVTLFSNMVFFFASLVTAGIVPRALGPKQLGDFSFLNRVSSAIRSFFDLGASAAFSNYNSKYEKTGPLVKVYSVWFIGQLFAILSLIILSALIGIKGLIWPGQELKYIIWVTIFDWVFFSVNILKQLSDSKGLTIPAQLISLSIGLINISLLVFFALKGFLNLGLYIAIQTFSSAAISLAIILWVVVPHRDLYWEGKVRGNLKKYFDYFYTFCSPLVVVTFVSFVFEYFDRIILQKFSGSVYQGYFHIASSWAAFATLFTTSILSIYKREMANSLGKENIARASEIFTRYLKMMYFLALVMSVFLAFHAKTLLEIIAGPKFIPAKVVLIIMAFYPAHLVYGQLGGAAFYASERTAQLRNISVIAMALGIPFSYFLLAPKYLAIPGLGLGAVGLALKTVIWNLIVVQIYLIYNCRYFKINPRPFWRHQAYSLAVLVSLMFILKEMVGFFFKGVGLNFEIFKLLFESLAYFIVVGGIIYYFPKIVGINRDEMITIIKRIKEKLHFAH